MDEQLQHQPADPPPDPTAVPTPDAGSAGAGAPGASPGGAEVKPPPTPEGVVRFLSSLFEPKDEFTLRLIETWTEGEKKRSRVIYPEPGLEWRAGITTPSWWARYIKLAEMEHANLFFGVCPRPKKNCERSFHVRIVRCLWTDIDHCTPEEAVKRCEKAGLPRPSIIVNSGNGVHLYWLLKEPYLIDDAGNPRPIGKFWVEVRRADGSVVLKDDGKPKKYPRNYIAGKPMQGEEECIWEFLTDERTGGDSKKRNPLFPSKLSQKALHIQHVVQGLAKQIGGDHTQDLARLLRLPCTMNRKDERNGKKPVPCELVECDPERRYPFAEFERFAAYSPDEVRADEVAKIRLPKRKLTQGRLDKLGQHINLCLTAEDRSTADFRLCCFAIRQGLDKEVVWQQVAEVGKFGQRGRAYFDLTWGNAEERVRLEIHKHLRKASAEAGSATNGPTNGQHGHAGGGGGGGPTASQGDGEGGRRLPCIQGNKRQLPEVTADALDALRAANDPPTLFQRGNALTRLRARANTGAPYLETLEDNALRGLMARSAYWTRAVNTAEGERIEDAPPPIDAVKDLMALPGWDGIPLLDSVSECPVFGQDGALVATPGYHPGARLWYSPGDGLDVPGVSDNPSRDEIDLARNLLRVELFGDFPFKDDASVAHAVAAFLLPFVRRLIDGPTPLHLFDAPTEGTGKTLLVSCITVVAAGREPEGFTESANDDEWRKRLTAALEEGGTFVFIDNLNRILDTGALASILTARTWKDRKLGFTKMLTLPNTAVWLASGNNTRLSRELIRRTVFSRLDAKSDAPWERKGFRHPNLLKWTKENRGRLVWAALTLGRVW